MDIGAPFIVNGEAAELREPYQDRLDDPATAPEAFPTVHTLTRDAGLDAALAQGLAATSPRNAADQHEQSIGQQLAFIHARTSTLQLWWFGRQVRSDQAPTGTGDDARAIPFQVKARAPISMPTPGFDGTS